MAKVKVDAYEILRKVRTQKPVVHHLTNWVTIYDCANIVKTLGASPVMAHAKEEVADMAAISSSLVLNIGTLTTEFVDSMRLAAKAANRKGIPVVLDVCGAGATAFRNKKSFELLDELRIDIIKGNASEIARIAGEAVVTKGVDAGDVKQNLVLIAQNLASKRNCVVVVTGKEDIVTNG
ncbi:MAG: hydroxyethylthiazole kinase, partial [Candidatus Omnitrophota bacterium]